jgi:MoxR-like ATPase
MAKIDCWTVAETTVSASRGNTLLYGPPGTGKSFLAQAGAGDDCFNLTLTPETPSAELRGHYHPRGGEFVWQDGPVVSAMRRGCRIVLNEIDHAGGDTLSFLLAALDNRESCRITLPSGETIRPAPGFHAVATMNGKPADLHGALRDRFSAAIEVDTVNPTAVEGLPEDLRNAARGTVNNFDDSDRITLRSWLAFADLRTVISPTIAAQAVFGRDWQAVLDSLTVAAADD